MRSTQPCPLLPRGPDILLFYGIQKGTLDASSSPRAKPVAASRLEPADPPRFDL